MPPLLSLHALAATRGDGLRPQFVDLFTRLAAGADATHFQIRSASGRDTAFEPAKRRPELRIGGATGKR
mgnify:CR=1 FL=1